MWTSVCVASLTFLLFVPCPFALRPSPSMRCFSLTTLCLVCFHTPTNAHALMLHQLLLCFAPSCLADALLREGGGERAPAGGGGGRMMKRDMEPSANLCGDCVDRPLPPTSVAEC